MTTTERLTLENQVAILQCLCGLALVNGLATAADITAAAAHRTEVALNQDVVNGRNEQRAAEAAVKRMVEQMPLRGDG